MKTIYPLSPGQEAMWLICQIAPESVAYNIFITAKIHAYLEIAVVNRVWQKIIEKHPILRTTYTSYEGKPVQQVNQQENFQVEVIDASDWSEYQLVEKIYAIADRPFNLEKDSVLRVNLFTRSAEEHILLLTMHHIASDMWSYDLLLGEFQTLYTNEIKRISQGQTETVDSLSGKKSYADFVHWQSEMLSGSRGEKQWQYWQKQLAGELPILNLLPDKPRPPVKTYEGASYIVKLDEQLIEKLKHLALASGTSLYRILLTAFYVQLYRYTNQTDILLCSPMRGRPGKEFKEIVGYFSNLTVLRVSVQENATFTELLAQVSKIVRQAQKHQDYPFSLLAEKLQPQRDPSRSPFSQVSFAWQAQTWCEPKNNSLHLQKSVLPMEPHLFGQQGGHLDLSLMVREAKGEIEPCWQYNTDLFEAVTIERMAKHFVRLLNSIVLNPQQPIFQLSMLTEVEQRQLLFDWNNTQADYPLDKCIHQLFEEQVERTPNAVAVVFEGQQLTYNELNCRANQLAHYLRKLGVKADTLVGISLERSLEMMVGLLGILKAGGAYVPLDPEYPKERIEYILSHSDAKFLITSSQILESFPNHRAQVICLDTDKSDIAQENQNNPKSQVGAEHLCYVIFTSGSTGKPKGVQICHQSLVNFIHSMKSEPGLTAQDCLVAVTTISFDIHTLEIYLPLVVGAKLILASSQIASDGLGLAELIATHQATVMQATPATWRILLSPDWQGNPKLKAICGGEALPRELADSLLAKVGSLWNIYGPTETTVWSTTYEVKRDRPNPRLDTPEPIGRPIANTQVYILDSSLQPVPIGVPGELYIGGDGVARGYFQQPDLTAERFLSNPFLPNSPLYKTGDLARYLSDGNIEYLGRIDNQVKIRGFRIELGEIETVLSQHTAVKTAVVIAREDETNQKRLVAYIIPKIEIISTPKEQNSLNVTELRQFLKAKLPEYMIPSAFVILESLPLTPNGKTDYRALPAPEFQSQEQYIAPRNPIEEILVTIWSEVLKVKQVSINHNFFELGGHSLLATQLISRIRTNFSIEIPLRSLFTAPTIEELSQQIQQLQQQDLTLSAPPILPRGEQSELLLSYAQTRLWFLDQLEPNSAFYNIPVALRLQGHLNQSALTQSLEEIIQRHEALRTNFITVNGQPNQVIQTVTNWAVSVIDLQHLSPKEQEIAAKKLVKEQAFKTFDLGKEALVRATLILLNNNEYWLLLCLHHVISDGWSMGVLIEELTALYNAVNQGQPSPLKPLPIQYADFAIWQRQWLQGEVLENQLNYWKKQLADAPTFLPLPTDKPRPAVQTFTGAHQEFQLSLELTQKLTELSQQQGVTMFMTLLAAYGILLYRYTGQSDILIGTPIANRNRREIESLIGFFVNTLVMRTDCSENPSFQELLMRVREMSLGAYAHQDLPFEMLVEALQPERNLSHTPLFQVMFALENTPLSKIELMDLTIDSLPLEGETAKFDLTLSMQNTETGLMGVWVYNTDLFNSETIEKMNGHFLTLLEGIITNPSERVSQLPLLTKVEQQQLLIDWNNTEVDYPANKCIHQLFEEQVERTPNAVAVTYENESLTYRELNNRANQLAHYLRKLGVKPDTLAGICVERSLEMMVGLLGILKAGGAYVPLDPEYPQERLSFMLEDSQVKVLVTQAKLVKSIPEHQAQLICLDTEWEKIAQNITSNPESVAKPENLIYIIYTSGSTGKPKGVLVNHSNVVRLFAATDAWYNFNSQDVWSLFHSYAFDFSVWEMWGALLYGGRLVVVPYLVTRSTEAFYQLLCQEKVTILNQTPTAFRQLIQAEESLKGSFPLSRGDRSSTTDNDLSLRLVIFGGEALEINSLQPWFQRHGDQCPQLVNMYGITETTVHVTYRPLSMNDLNSTASVIGRPIPDLQVYLLDQHLQLVPVGVPGEMYVGGAGVTKGYLNRPELTTERFISSPFEKDEVIPPTPLNKGGNEPSKLYKTGDLGRYLPDGNIEYLGRIDNQVKIRGFRIELGEIEALLASHPQIWETVVIVRDDATGDKRLVAYIVPQSEKTITINEIRQFLKAQLPGYMIPNAFVILDALPLTANGKIDSRALPPPESSSEASDKYAAPRNPIEDILVTVWSEVLKVEKVGINDNFFELGGHSLLATKLVAQIRDRLKVELPLRQLFNSATLAELAQGIEQLKQQKSDTIVPAILPRKRK
jgi:amino acid adenylation domain-containing protein